MAADTDTNEKSLAGFFRLGGILLSLVGGLILFIILYLLFGRRQTPESDT